jgi:hypothetical protein
VALPLALLFEVAHAQTVADATNVAVILANRTATAAARATFEAQNAGAIARHGAAEPTQTPGPTWTPTATLTRVPPTSASATPTDPPDTPTPAPCADQFSWQLQLDGQGNAITQLDESGQVLGLWQDADGDQMWAPSTYFCPDSADTPTPTDEPTDTTTAAVAVVPSPTPTPAPTAFTRCRARAPGQAIVEFGVVILLLLPIVGAAVDVAGTLGSSRSRVVVRPSLP